MRDELLHRILERFVFSRSIETCDWLGFFFFCTAAPFPAPIHYSPANPKDRRAFRLSTNTDKTLAYSYIM